MKKVKILFDVQIEYASLYPTIEKQLNAALANHQSSVQAFFRKNKIPIAEATCYQEVIKNALKFFKNNISIAPTARVAGFKLSKNLDKLQIIFALQNQVTYSVWTLEVPIYERGHMTRHDAERKE